MIKNTKHKLIDLVARLFQYDQNEINLDMAPGDIPKWDSLGHIILLEAIEKEFSVNIPLDQGLNALTLKDLLSVIEQQI